MHSAPLLTPCPADRNKTGTMRFSASLLLVSLLCGLTAAAPVQASTRALHSNPAAQEMLQTLQSMSHLLNSVNNHSTAENATPRLIQLYKDYKVQQAAAEKQPPMSSAGLTRHLAQMDSAMNNFRMACARLMQEKFYGSARLGNTVKKLVQTF